MRVMDGAIGCPPKPGPRTMAEEFGLYTVVRPGPYICAEWDGGGFPQWLVALKRPPAPRREQMWLQTDDPVYLAWARHWYDAVCPVIAKHQITRKPTGSPGVILVQIENEYNRLKLPADVAIVTKNRIANVARRRTSARPARVRLRSRPAVRPDRAPFHRDSQRSPAPRPTTPRPCRPRPTPRAYRPRSGTAN